MNEKPSLNWFRNLAGTWGWSFVAAAAFSAANCTLATAPLILIYLFALMQLAGGDTWRQAFYPGLGVGLIIAATHLTFFWTIFSGGALALWLVFAVWIGIFAVAARFCLRTFGNWGWFMAPVLWMGLEYFRSELYPLKFSWLSPGYTFSGGAGQVWIRCLGTYGVGAWISVLAALAAVAWRRQKAAGLGVLAIGILLLGLPGILSIKSIQSTGKHLKLAGVQLEFPTEREVITCLTAAIRHHPEIELIVLPEYTLGEAPSSSLKGWCRTNRTYIIVGGKDPVPPNHFRNTAYVISPAGEIAFKQAKCTPIQFFKDGLPADHQQLWKSPWGKIGICICYDLSYTRVTDVLARLGAQALIVPTMDVVDWGRRQHELHARIAPARAVEYGLPVFRLASSGISQNVNKLGKVDSTAGFPGQGELLLGEICLGPEAVLPLDRQLAPGAVLLSLGFIGAGAMKRLTARPKPRAAEPSTPLIEQTMVGKS